MAEPNGDLRVVNYVADASNGFKADVNVQSGASPIKPTNTISATGPFSNHRTGISAPQRNRKPVRGFQPIVVKSLPHPQPLQSVMPTSELLPPQPYQFYKEFKNESTIVSTSTSATKKSIQVDLTFSELTTEKVMDVNSVFQSHDSKPIPIETSTDNKNFNLQSLSYLSQESGNTVKPNSPTSGLYQLRNMDIPSSIMEILNQNKVKTENIVETSSTNSRVLSSPTSKTFTHETATIVNPVKIDLTQNTENSTELPKSLKEEQNNLPQRPMRLIGLHPIYIDTVQLQTITDNLTSIPQLHLEPFSNIQYATPLPFYHGTLPNGPAGPFRNVPRSANDPNIAEMTLYNTIPLINSIPISAPIMTQPVSLDTKVEPKFENKLAAAQSSLPLCSDCLLPSSYIPYSVVKLPASSATPVASNGNNPNTNTNVNINANSNTGSQKTPCSSNSGPPIQPPSTPLWPPYTPSIAYILMPTPILKSKINETRPLVANIWSK